MPRIAPCHPYPRRQEVYLDYMFDSQRRGLLLYGIADASFAAMPALHVSLSPVSCGVETAALGSSVAFDGNATTEEQDVELVRGCLRR